MHLPFSRIFFCCALLLIVFMPHSATAQSEAASRLKEQIRQEQQQARRQKEQVQLLTKKERSLYKNLAAREDKVKGLLDEIWEQENVLADIEIQQKKILQEHKQIQAKRAKTEKKLDAILANLWPVHRNNVENKFRGLSSWDVADRRFTWLSALYNQGARTIELYREQSAQLAANLAKQEQLKTEAQAQLKKVNSRKNDLLAQKLALVGEIRTLRAEKLSLEQELHSIVEEIDKLNYRLKALTTRKITQFKGSLPWPMDGKVVQQYAPSKKPPVRGLGFASNGNDGVRAVSWGTVVHNDLLRGFGRVIILNHGEGYYTLYAFLTESNVRTGQEVEKDEIIGTAGYYPPAKGNGMYFELRFHKKAINPKRWLSAKR